MESSTKSKSIQISSSPTNDTYSLSINSIVLSRIFSSIEELKEALESSGYYGRVEVRKVSDGKSKDCLVKIKVYLPDSKVSYEWPFMASYSLNKGCITKRKRPAAIKNNWKLLKCMYFLFRHDYKIEDLDSAANDGYLIMGWATKKEYVELLRFLIKHELVWDGKLILKSAMDVRELYENLFDHTFYSLD